MMCQKPAAVLVPRTLHTGGNVPPTGSCIIILTKTLFGSPDISPSCIEKVREIPSGFQFCACPASSSFKVFLIIKAGEISVPSIDFIGNKPELVGPSIVPPPVFNVFILTLKLPAVVAIIFAISNLIVLPAETLSGLFTVYFKIEPVEDNEPEPIPILSIYLVA